MDILAKVINKVRGVVEKEEEQQEYSGGFLPCRVRDKALSLMQEGKTILDVGCGEGLLLYHLSTIYKGKKLYGIDPWEGILDKAVNRVDAFFSIGEGGYLPFKDESFEEVTMLNLLMNMPDIKMVEMILKEATRVCKKGGKIIFDYRNAKNPLIWYSYRTIEKHDPDIKVPVIAHNRRQIKKVINNAGVKSKVSYYSIPVWWAINSPACVVEVYKL